MDEKCTICLGEGQMDLTLLCTHHFHESCIAEWLTEQDTCPICRANAIISDTTLLILRMQYRLAKIRNILSQNS
jgi:hypothetical protein